MSPALLPVSSLMPKVRGRTELSGQVSAKPGMKIKLALIMNFRCCILLLNMSCMAKNLRFTHI